MKNSLAKNSIYNIVYKLLNIGYPLITSAYISRVLMPEGVGQIALAKTFVSYYTTVAALGIPNYGIKVIGSVQNDCNSRSKNFIELFIINAFSTVICFIFFWGSINWLSQSANVELLMIFSSLIIFNILNVDWFYQGMEEYGYIASRSTIIKFISLILILLFVKSQEDCVHYAIILCFATVGNYFFNIVHIRKYIIVSLKKINIKKHLKTIFILFASVCATEVYTMLDTTMIGIFCSKNELGYYSNSINLIRVVFSFITAMCTVYFPRLSFLYKKKLLAEFNSVAQQGLDLSIFFAFPAAIGLFVLADNIAVVLFGASFSPAANTIRLLSVLIIIFSIAYIAGHVILMAINKEIYIMYATIVAAVINFILNIVLIHFVGYNGAAIATVCAEATVTIILVYTASKFIKRNHDKKFLKSLIISLMTMFLGLVWLRSVMDNTVTSLLIQIIIGVVLYLGTSLLTRNKISIYIVKSISNHFVK